MPLTRLIAALAVAGLAALAPGVVSRFGSDRLRHAAWVTSLAYSPDGKTLASAGQDGAVKLWDAATDEPRSELAGPGSGALAVAWSPDGRRLAVAGGDSTVRVLDSSSGAEAARIAGFEQAVLALAFSPDGKTLAVGTRGDEIALLDAATAAPISELSVPARGTFALAFTRDGSRLLAGGDGGSLIAWDVAKRTVAARLDAATGAIYAVAVLPDGATVAAGGDDGTLRIFDLATGRVVRSTAARGAIAAIAAAPDGKSLALAAGPAIRIVSLPDLSPVAPPPGAEDEITAVAISASGARVAIASRDGTLRVFERSTGAEIALVEPRTTGADAIAFETASETRLVAAWHTGDIARIDLDARTKESDVFSLVVGEPSFACALSPDGATIASLAPGLVVLENPATFEITALATGEPGRVSAVAVAPGGALVALGAVDGSIELLRPPASSAPERRVAVHRQRVVALAFSRDGRRLASASLDGAVHVAAVGGNLTPFSRHERPARSLAFGPDGRTLLAGLADTTAVLLDLTARPAPR